jgi:hypothetical protein
VSAKIYTDLNRLCLQRDRLAFHNDFVKKLLLSYLLNLSFLSFFWWDQSLNSGPHIYSHWNHLARTKPHLSCRTVEVWLIFNKGFCREESMHLYIHMLIISFTDVKSAYHTILKNNEVHSILYGKFHIAIDTQSMLLWILVNLISSQ